MNAQERERFEAWAKSRGNQMQMIEGEYVCPITSDQWEAWQAACPEGWQVVPVEPTEAMTAKMSLGSATDAPNKEPIEFWKRAWVRTLAAAPHPGEE